MVGEQSEEIPTFLNQALLVTFLCCPASGGVAIAQAARVRKLVEAGDRAAAREASRQARRWVLLSYLLGAAMIATTILIGWVAKVVAERHLIPWYFGAGEG